MAVDPAWTCCNWPDLVDRSAGPGRCGRVPGPGRIGRSAVVPLREQGGGQPERLDVPGGPQRPAAERGSADPGRGPGPPRSLARGRRRPRGAKERRKFTCFGETSSASVGRAGRGWLAQKGRAW